MQHGQHRKHSSTVAWRRPHRKHSPHTVTWHRPHRKHSFLYCCMLERVYGAVAWQCVTVSCSAVMICTLRLWPLNMRTNKFSCCFTVVYLFCVFSHHSLKVQIVTAEPDTFWHIIPFWISMSFLDIIGHFCELLVSPTLDDTWATFRLLILNHTSVSCFLICNSHSTRAWILASRR
jgi:hypothetical protein